MPLNPLKIKLMPLLNATMSTFFSQNWSLFAPNPVAQDYIMLVQLRTKDELTSSNHRSWYNLSTPFWKNFQRNRFSAYDRLARSQSSALRNALSGDVSLVPLYESCRNGDTLACSLYRSYVTDIRKDQIKKLVKIASAFCNDINAESSNYTHIAIRIRIKSFPPWSRRHDKKISIKDYNLGVYRIDEKIVPFGLFN